ncbi:MAG: hypothetical protein GY870_11360 [archaeon]|nr:hypothetical protein [archaeon]
MKDNIDMNSYRKITEPNYGSAGIAVMALIFVLEIEMGGITVGLFLNLYWLFFTLDFWSFLSSIWINSLRLALLPIILIIAMLLFIFVTAIIARILLKLMKKPEVGIFPADYKSKESKVYKRWSKRGSTRRIAIWMCYLIPVWEAQVVLLQLFGQCKIGKEVVISEKAHVDPELVELDDYAFIGLGASILTHSIDGDTIEFAPVKIGKRVIVGAHAVINAGAEIGDDAIIASGTIVLKHQKIPAGTTWGGNPAKQLK